MTLLQKIRLGAAIALLCAMFMPLSECSGGASAPAPASVQSAASAASSVSQDLKEFARPLVSRCGNRDDCRYVYKELDLSWESALKLLTFTWPLLFLAAAGKWSGRRFGWILHLLELLLCAGTLYMLWGFTLFDEPRYGTTVVLAAILAYGVSAIIYLVRAVRAAIIRRREPRQRATGSGSA